MSRILVTPRSLTSEGHPALERLARAGFEVVMPPAGKMPTAADLKQLVPGCVGWLAGIEPITDDVLSAASDLRVISRNGTGVDAIDLESARRRGIEIRRADGANARGVAELAIGMILALARSLPFSDAAIKAGGWERRKGFELEGKTLGVVGCGKIGRIVAALARGLGMLVVGHDPFAEKSQAASDLPIVVLPAFDLPIVVQAASDPPLVGQPAFDFPLVRLDELFALSHVITLHCPPPADGRPLVDARRLGLAKPGVVIVNTARHELVDIPALVAAIERGHVAGAALDVFDAEPPVERSYLASNRILATPHIGGFTDESVDRAVDVAVTNLLDALSLQPAAGMRPPETTLETT
ncbi:MAG: phosphoglycerate dehydrogenase, partial [Planctomycetes bacterium]|nr:phosphoglycerate dehydrogenase [Planctomycetota bacterium]